MTILIIGLILFLAITVYNRFVTEKAMTLLTDEQKGMLLGAFAAVRKWNIIILGVIIIAFLGLSQVAVFSKNQLMMGYFAALMVYTIAAGLVGYRKQMEFAFPVEYLSKVKLTLVLRAVSLVILVISLVLFFKNQGVI